MIPGDYKTFEFQLQQVQKQLESDPKNESLQKLEKKLQRLLELSKSLSQESQAAGDQSAQNAASINLAAGDQCDAKNKGVWQEAVIQSVSQDKRTCTVVFVGSAETCHCKAEEIRKPTVHTLQGKKRPR
jgi:phosphoserine aminotransferase